MDPQDNKSPTRSNDTQNNTPAAGADMTGASFVPSGQADPYGEGASVPTGAPDAANNGAGQVQGVEVDLSNPAGSNADTPINADSPAPADGGIVGPPADVAFNNDPALPSITSETSPTPVDQPGGAAPAPGIASVPTGLDATPPTTPGVGAGNPGDAPFGTPPAPSDPAPVTPSTLPVAAHPADKKTIFVLGGVAVILIALILFLFFR